MGLVTSFPYDRKTTVFENPDDHATTGELIIETKSDQDENITMYNNVTFKLWDHIAHQRQKFKEDRQKFESMDYPSMIRRWPQFSEGDIVDYHMQFLQIDTNKDGLIDIDELDMMLNEAGDKSTPMERIRLFEEVDLDGSGGIDFEEFLKLVDNMNLGRVSDGTAEGFSLLLYKGIGRYQRLKQRMTTGMQLEYGLF